MKLWKNLNESDRSQVIITILLFSFFTILILIAFLTSRGQDIEYFKNRIDMVDQRTLYMDQKIDKMNEKMAENRLLLNEVRKKDDELEKRIDEYGRWIEYWKTLPQLPKPPISPPPKR